jgi:hypothetical protein
MKVCVANTYEIDVNANLAQFELNGLWFNISEAMPDTDQCQNVVHRQLDWYLNADDVAQRRAALQIKQNARLHSLIMVRICRTEILWHSLRGLQNVQ